MLVSASSQDKTIERKRCRDALILATTSRTTRFKKGTSFEQRIHASQAKLSLAAAPERHPKPGQTSSATARDHPHQLQRHVSECGTRREHDLAAALPALDTRKFSGLRRKISSDVTASDRHYIIGGIHESTTHIPASSTRRRRRNMGTAYWGAAKMPLLPRGNVRVRQQPFHCGNYLSL